MKQLILFTVILLWSGGKTCAQPGGIALSSDRAQLCCDLTDQIPGATISIYVYHLFTTGATSSRFMIHQDPGVNLTYVGEVSSLPTVEGGSQTGIHISYGSCLSDPIHLLTVAYIGSGLSEPCSAIEIVPHPAANPQKVLVTDCSNPPVIWNSTGASLIVNPDAGCQCECWLVPVQPSSWGMIKALYRQN